MTPTTREELYAALAQIGVMGGIKEGVFDALFSSGGGAVAWADITSKPTTFPPIVGTTATTAKAGNYTPTSAEVSTALKAKAAIASLATVTTPDATDEATAITLVNALKVAVNQVIAALKA